MALVTLEEAKEYLRVDSADEDAMTGILLSAAERMCADVARLSDEKWAAVDSDTEDGSLTPSGGSGSSRAHADAPIHSVRHPRGGGVMNIAGLNVRIMIQKNETVTDRIGNHRSAWTNYFSCWATASDQTGDEGEEASQIKEEDRIDFTVRYCSETAAVTAKGYRILLGERIYNITHVDDMGFRKNSRKFMTKLEAR